MCCDVGASKEFVSLYYRNFIIATSHAFKFCRWEMFARLRHARMVWWLFVIRGMCYVDEGAQNTPMHTQKQKRLGH